MTDQPVVQISRLLDERGLSSFQIKLIVWSFFIVLIDGYDIAAIAFAAPHLVQSWGVAPGALGPVFSASLLGILFGSALFGWVGDRFGRKAALVSSNIVFGVFTWAAAYSTNLDQMFWLRLLAGLGIGGVIPNVVAINAESAPRQLRATLAIIAVGCVPIGGAIPGIVTAVLVPKYGWPILFMIGGIAPIVIAVAAMFGLPESIKFMAIRESQRGKMEQLIAAIRPDFKVPPNARFVIEGETQFPGFNPTYLFRDGLALITPLLWLLFAIAWNSGWPAASQLDPHAAHRGPTPPDDGGSRRHHVAGRRHSGGAGAVLVAPTAPFSRHSDHIRDRRPDGRLDRLCRIDLQDRIAGRNILRRLLRPGHSIRPQRGRCADLPDVAARQRIGMAVGAGTGWLDRRAAGGSLVRRSSGPESLHVVGASLRRRRHHLLRDSSSEYDAFGRAPGFARGAIGWAAHTKGGRLKENRSGWPPVVLRQRLRTARTRAKPGSPSRRTVGWSA